MTNMSDNFDIYRYENILKDHHGLWPYVMSFYYLLVESG